MIWQYFSHLPLQLLEGPKGVRLEPEQHEGSELEDIFGVKKVRFDEGMHFDEAIFWPSTYTPTTPGTKRCLPSA